MINNFSGKKLHFRVIDSEYSVINGLLTCPCGDNQRNADFINTVFIKCKVNKFFVKDAHGGV